MTPTANESPATEPTTFRARPCPFCGGVELEMEELEENTAYAVVCHTCCAIGPAVENMKDAQKAARILAINYWNKRGNDGPSDDLERTA